MDHAYRLSDAGSSLIALVLIATISATAILLLPRRDHAHQLFWIVPCLALALGGAARHALFLPVATQASLDALVGFVVSIVLSRRATKRAGVR